MRNIRSVSKMRRFLYPSIILSLLVITILPGCGGGSSGSESRSSEENVTFKSIVQTGGVSGTADSTSLTLTFDGDPTTLTADNITVKGATKGVLSGSGTIRSLEISNITAGNGEAVTVDITSPSGYVIAESSQAAVIYRLLTVGMDYLGGKLAYILQSGDPGYDASVPHGLIAAKEDQGDVSWGWEADTTGKVLGTGSSNTDVIIAAEGGLSNKYAAGLARSYNGGGYKDWFLPSIDELKKLYLNRVVLGIEDDSSRWTSSSGSSGGNQAYVVMFWNDGNQALSTRESSEMVRAVRYF